MNLPQSRHGGGRGGHLHAFVSGLFDAISTTPRTMPGSQCSRISWKVKYTGSLPNWLHFSDRKTLLACLTTVGRPFSKSPRCTKPENHLGRDVDPLFTEEEAKRTSLD